MEMLYWTQGVLKKDAILDSKVLAEPAVGELAMTQYVMTSCGSAPKTGACKEEEGGCVVLDSAHLVAQVGFRFLR